MNARNVLYWTTTMITAFCFLSGGAANVFRVDETIQASSHSAIPAASWALRPASRVLGAVTGEPHASARTDAHELATATS
jgi:hypothetical protein